MKWLQQNKLIALLALIKFALPFLLVNSVWELHRDEYLYYAQGQRFDFGYLENPPFIAWLGYISSLLGGGVFWIKLWPSLFGALTLLVTAAMVRELGAKLYAQVIAALGILFSAYMRTHFLFQPNFLDIFFWSLSAYYLIRYINTRQDKCLRLLSIALALGWWSKYSILFFIAALVIALLLTPHRKLFIQKRFWLAIWPGIALVIPNIGWQYFHHFPLIHHMNELRETQLQYIDKTDFLKGQLLMLLPVSFVWIAGLVWLLRSRTYRIVAFIYIGIIILLMLGSGKGYYSLGAYPMLLAAGGVCLERVSNTKKWLRYAFVVIILAVALPFIPVLLPLQSPAAMAEFNKKHQLEKLGILKWEDQRNHALQQDFADMLGWKELAAKSEKVFDSLTAQKYGDMIVYCRSYGQVGALEYYGKDDYFKSKVLSDNGSFLLWISPGIEFKHLLFIGRIMPGRDDEVFNHFKKITVLDSVTNPLSRSFGTKIIFYEQADSLASVLARKGLMEMKQEFGN